MSNREGSMARNAALSSAASFASTDAGIGLDRAAWGARFLQPQTVGSTIRNSVSIYLRYWPTICLIYILPLLPLGVLQEMLSRQGHRGWAAVCSLTQLLLGILVGAALIVAVSDICLGLKPNLRRAYRRGFGNGRLLKTYFTLLLFLLGGILLLVVPGLVLMVWYMFALPATVLEQFSGRAALRRSRELGRGFCWRNIGVLLVNGLFVGFTLLVAIILLAIVDYFTIGTNRPVLEGVLGAALGIAVLGPLTSIPLILLYYDMRARKEGYGAAQLVEDLKI